jgi:hypothetical protein
MTLSEGKEVINFQTSQDVDDFESLLWSLADKHHVIVTSDQGCFHLFHTDEYELGTFVDYLFDCLDDAFETWEVKACRLWKYRLESRKGGSIYFLGDEKDEPAWMTANLVPFRPVGPTAVPAN